MDPGTVALFAFLFFSDGSAAIIQGPTYKNEIECELAKPMAEQGLMTHMKTEYGVTDDNNAAK